MMKHEFEAIAGYEVSFEDYNNIIEPMYMAIPEYITKADFVKMIDKKRFALKPISKIMKEMKQIAAQIEETCTHYTDYDAKEKLESLCREYIDRKGLKGIAGFIVNEEMKQTCYFPVSVSIYGFKTYENIEVINLI